ncbi:hypothetical protein DYB37_005101 [Aphanomyces astaci]|uniref:Uncharacterized protein n=1 Tax=Aphanomyces astaci TaxID=112090 RepID=A0A3L6V998_APHAT|nr:hypothetical protein DYB35_004237 [Aphanomyces astaci]RHZ22811.1 hypothetical protein DYB37_005101 [Aphanomyces astaci]RLO05307.1 hypothetical protein DYB28_005405 [Aphanomyces astaci]
MLPSCVFFFLVMAWVPSTFAASFEFRSHCSYPIDVYDNAVTCSLQPNSTGCGSETCTSLAECMRVTAKVGFNVAMSIFPNGPSRNDPMYNCQYVVCYANGCNDAYQYPSDDIKTKSCPDTTNFVVTFCPDLPP